MTNFKKVRNFNDFMENYYYSLNIYSGNRERVEFYPFQKDIIEKIENNPITLVLKSRQMFTTSLLCYYCAFKIIKSIENKDKSMRIILHPHNSFMGQQMLSKIKEIIKSFNEDIFNLAIKNNISELKFGDKFFIKSTVSTVGVNSIDIYDLIIFDEAAFNNNFEGSFKLAASIENPIGKLIAISSNNKSNDFFFNTINSIENIVGVSKNKIHYSSNPTVYTEENIERMKSILGDDKFNVEMELLPAKKGEENTIKNNKGEMISFRTDTEFKNKLDSFLYKKSELKGEFIKISDYIRGLIEKDMKKG